MSTLLLEDPWINQFQRVDVPERCSSKSCNLFSSRWQSYKYTKEEKSRIRPREKYNKKGDYSLKQTQTL